MDIVDAQIHANVLPIDTVVAMMAALGINAALLDEFAGVGDDGARLPCVRLADGVTRPVGPFVQSASLRYPDRFAHLVRINPLDPELDAWIDVLAASPGMRALRLVIMDPPEVRALAEGRCGPVFAAARRHALPLFVTCPGNLPLLASTIEQHDDVPVVIDHCGVRFDGPRGEASLDDALAMAQYPHVALKWAHAAKYLSREDYPCRDLDQKLSRVVGAFGPERVMWASDFSVIRQTWAEALFSVRDCSALSASDKEWVLGRTARTILNWPATEVAPRRPW